MEHLLVCLDIGDALGSSQHYKAKQEIGEGEMQKGGGILKTVPFIVVSIEKY